MAASDQVQLALTFPRAKDMAVLTQAAAQQVWQYLEQGQDVALPL